MLVRARRHALSTFLKVLSDSPSVRPSPRQAHTLRRLQTPIATSPVVGSYERRQLSTKRHRWIPRTQSISTRQHQGYAPLALTPLSYVQTRTVGDGSGLLRTVTTNTRPVFRSSHWDCGVKLGSGSGYSPHSPSLSYDFFPARSRLQRLDTVMFRGKGLLTAIGCGATATAVGVGLRAYSRRYTTISKDLKQGEFVGSLDCGTT